MQVVACSCSSTWCRLTTADAGSFCIMASSVRLAAAVGWLQPAPTSCPCPLCPFSAILSYLQLVGEQHAMVERHVRDLEHTVLRGSSSNLGGGSHSSIPDLALGLRVSETQVPVSCCAAAIACNTQWCRDGRLVSQHMPREHTGGRSSVADMLLQAASPCAGGAATACNTWKCMLALVHQQQAGGTCRAVPAWPFHTAGDV